METEKTLYVTEIYPSIQGESTYAGLPCVFIRLTGCDLRCSYCDTEYAFYGGNEKTLKEILNEVNQYEISMVEITGGEPLLQKNVHPLMRILADQGKVVLLETSGAHDISICDPRVVRIVDLKCPSSGETTRNRWENLGHITRRDEIKFVIGNRKDFDWALEIVQQYKLTRKCPILFSAVWETLPLTKLGGWIRDCQIPIRLQPQLHKILWGATAST